MKKITSLILLFACAIGFSQSKDVKSLGENNPVFTQKKQTTFSSSDFSKMKMATYSNLDEIQAAKKAAENQEVVTYEQVLKKARSSNISNSGSIINTAKLSKVERQILKSYPKRQSKSVLADFIPTAGATETFTPAVGDFFFDPGGPGGSETTDGEPGNYPNCGCVTTTTLDGVTELEFLQYYVFANFDWLRIYDGADTSGTILWDTSEGGMNDGERSLADMIAANGSAVFVGTSGSMTFEFNSSTVVDRLGWEVEILAAGGGGGGGSACSQDNPSNAFENGKSNNANLDRIVANDVEVDADTDYSLESITINEFMNPGVTAATVDVYIYEDNGGIPGAVLASELGVVPSSQTVIGANFGFDLSEVVIDITPVNLTGQAGLPTTYWIGTSLLTSDATNCFWENTTASIVGNGEAYDDGTGVGYVVDPALDGVYEYSGTCTPIGGGGGDPCTSTAYDSTAVPFDIDGADTTTADCANAPNEIPITVTDNGTIGDGATLENITIDIAHTWSSDLDISLISPAGTELVLAEDLGGSTDDAYNGTMFEDGGADISTATAPFGVGPYMAVGGTFADTFDGESISGDWILKVCDDSSGDTGTVLQFSMSICVPPTNDECENAYALSCGDTYIGETTSDTDSGGNAAPDEFFSYTGSGDTEIVTVSLCGSGTDFDTVLKVYDSCDLTTIVAENDDSCGLQSEVSFVSDGSSTYLIMVEGFGSSSGNFELEVTCEEPLENDFCETALPITCGETITGSTDGATPDTGAPECSGVAITAPGVWYTFTDDSGLVTDYTISLCDSDYDTKLSVYTGECGTLVCEAGNDDSCGLQSEVSFQGDGNTTYYILVHGFGGAIGNYSLNVDCLPVPPPNDMIANSIDVDEIGFPYTDPAVAMPAATTEGGNPNGCNIDGANGVWYNFVANGDGEATASITSPAGASVVTFFEAPDENSSETDLTLVNQGTNQCLPGTSTTINTTAGQAYYVFVVNTGGTTDITIDGTNLGTEDNALEGFSYYPNPADDMLSLRAMDNIENVAIYSILGQKVMDRPIGNVTAEFDISSLSTGTYIMKVSVNGEIGTYKVIKR